MTVWVVHPVKDDLSAALQFGELKYINGGYVHGDELESIPNFGEVIPANVLDKMSAAASEYKPTLDYLLIAGDHLQIAQFIALLIRRWEQCTVLRYDRQAKGYFPVELV